MKSKQVQHARAPLDRIRALKAEGLSLRQIAEQLQQDGVPPPGRSSRWHHNAVDRLLARAGARPEEAPTPPPSPTPQPSPTARLHVKIHGPWIATDSLLWEFLLQKVGADLLTQSEHTIPLTEAVRGLRLPPGRQDQEHLWDALDRLAASRVVWQGQLDDTRLSIVAPLLSAWLIDARLSFAFSPALVKLLKDPGQYGRLKELLGARN